MNNHIMLDKKMTPPEQQKGGNPNPGPNDPVMSDQPSGNPQGTVGGDSAVNSPIDQPVPSQDDQPSDNTQTDDTTVLGAYPPVPPQDEGDIQDTQGSSDDTSQPTVVDTQNVNEGKPTNELHEDKQAVGENIQPADKTPLPVGDEAPPQDTSGGATEESGVDDSVKDMAKPVEPPPVDESQVTKEQSEGDQSQGQDVSAVDSSQLPQGTSSEQAQPGGSAAMQPQTSPANEGQSPAGGVPPSQIGNSQSSASFQIPPASHTVGPTDQGQAQPIPPSPGGDTVPVAPLSQSQDDNTEEQTMKKAHEPVFILPDDYHAAMTIPIHIRVSSVPHPMDEDHYIQSIELFANGTSVGKVDLQPKENEVAEAEFQVNVQKGMVLRAVATCNRHGDWASEKTI